MDEIAQDVKVEAIHARRNSLKGHDALMLQRASLLAGLDTASILSSLEIKKDPSNLESAPSSPVKQNKPLATFMQ